MSDSIKTTVLNLLGVEFDGTLGESEPLLDERGQFADATTLLSENLLSVGGTDDDLGPLVGYANLTSRVSLGRKSSGEELGKFSADSIVDSRWRE